MCTKCGKIGDLSIRKNILLRQEKLVEARGNEDGVRDEFQCRSDSNAAEQNTEYGYEGGQQNQKLSKRSKGDKLLEFFWKFPTSPINNLFNNSVWFNSQWKYLPLNNTHIKSVQRIFQRQLCDMSFIYFMNKIKDSELLFYNCGVRDVNDYYYTTDQSLRIVVDLLMFQYSNNVERVTNILDREIPKKIRPCGRLCVKIFALRRRNATQRAVWTRSNAGKNYVFDAVIHYFLNFGQIGNFKKYNNFPLMECVNRRIILWNEPHCETSPVTYLRAMETESRCFIEGCQRSERYSVPLSTRKMGFLDSLRYNSVLTFTAKHIQDMMSLKDVVETRLFHFYTIDDMEDHFVHTHG
ncbi:unnamed protein product [Leptidea sinapis]|uniref:Uncharacterized protein n=1 Tax=Leptidea sinapis TaxID=189913 RepID=A0A5E4R5N4_9NEOP|nr:unnamed protein product [Leptidea sinapis]